MKYPSVQLCKKTGLIHLDEKSRKQGAEGVRGTLMGVEICKKIGLIHLDEKAVSIGLGRFFSVFACEKVLKNLTCFKLNKIGGHVYTQPAGAVIT